RTLSEDCYCQHEPGRRARHDLSVSGIANRRVGCAVSDPVDGRHRPLLPDYVWGDGQPVGVRQRALEEMIATVRAAQKLGASVVSGFTGSGLWSFVAGYPGPTPALVAAGLEDFARAW